MAKKKLTVAAVSAAKPEARPYEIWDTDQKGLVLRVQPSGVKSYVAQLARHKRRTIGDAAQLTLEQARVTMRAWLAQRDEGRLPAAARGESKVPTLGEFIEDQYTPWVTANKKAGLATLANLKAQWSHLYRRKLDVLEARDFETFKQKRIREGRKASTINRDLTRVRGVLSAALKWKAFKGPHPMADVAEITDETDSRVRYLSPAEDRRLRGALADREDTLRKQRESGNAHGVARGREPRPLWAKDAFADHLQPFVLLALNTGMRRGELFGLGWSAVDMKGRQVTVTAVTSKTSRTRHIPLNDEALGVLKRWKKQGPGEGLVFPGEDGKPMTNIDKSWRSLMKAAKLTDLRVHDLRHDFASKLVMSGAGLYDVRDLLGHADYATTTRYAHLAKSHLHEAVAKLRKP